MQGVYEEEEMVVNLLYLIPLPHSTELYLQKLTCQAFCSEGTPAIFSNKEVLGREGGTPPKDRSEMKPRMLKSLECCRKGCLVEGHQKGECRLGVLYDYRKSSTKSSVNTEVGKCN